MKKYAYYRRMILLDKRDRRANSKRTLREAVERQRREEAERERQAQKDFEFSSRINAQKKMREKEIQIKRKIERNWTLFLYRVYFRRSQ